LTDKTRNILDAAALAKTKKGVRIINCARGGLIVEAHSRMRSIQVTWRGRAGRVRDGAGNRASAVRL
jgi:hypothetical protein